MTGGTALPADFSPHPAPNAPDQPGQEAGPDGASGTGSSGNGADAHPKPFFAEHPEQFELGQQPSSEPSAGQRDQPGPGVPYGQPGLGPSPSPSPPSGPSGAGRPAEQAPGERDLGQRGQQAGWRPAQPQPQQRSRPQRPTEPPGRELRQRAIASLLFGVISLVALLGLGTDLHRGVYLLAFSLAVGLAACVIGITALVKARRTGSYRPRGAIGGIVLGALALLISVPILVTYLAFPTQVSNYVNCLSQAQNSSQQHACMTKFYKSIRFGA
jgi:hypothetical protein